MQSYDFFTRYANFFCIYRKKVLSLQKNEQIETMIRATEVLTKAQVKRVRSLQQKKFRVAEGLFVAEGDKCIEELMKGFRLEHLYREGENATRAEIEQMSSLRTPQGSIGVFRLPSREPITDNREPITPFERGTGGFVTDCRTLPSPATRCTPSSTACRRRCSSARGRRLGQRPSSRGL